MRMLVTGGAGFIGSHFVKRRAAAGDDVVVLDRLTYAGNPANLEGVPHEFHHGDIADAAAVELAGAGCEAVVNFAAETHVDRSILDPREFVHTEVARHADAARMGARARACATCRCRPTRCTATSRRGGRSREDDPLRPSSPYAAAKAAGDLQVLAYARTYGVHASITRAANTYGSNQYPEKMIPLFVTNALDGLDLPVYGDGKQVREWLHAEDHCAAVDLVLRDGRGGRGLQRRRRGVREPRGHAPDRRADRRRPVARPARRGPRRATTAATRSTTRSCARSAGRRSTRSARPACPRRSPGTASAATGGSRSSPARTASTTSGSTLTGCVSQGRRRKTFPAQRGISLPSIDRRFAGSSHALPPLASRLRVRALPLPGSPLRPRAGRASRSSSPRRPS